MNEASGGVGKNRIESLADGVFSIAMTLLILDVKVPNLPEGASLSAEVCKIWPALLVYAGSFLVVGVFWVAHHVIVHHVRHTDRFFSWLNIWFLLLVSAIPFSASLLGRYPREQVPVILYCAHLAFLGCSVYALLHYASVHRLLHYEAHNGFVRAGKRRTMVGPIMYCIAIAFSFVNTGISLILCLMTLIYYIIPSGVDRYWTAAPTPPSRSGYESEIHRGS